MQGGHLPVGGGLQKASPRGDATGTDVQSETHRIGGSEPGEGEGKGIPGRGQCWHLSTA